MKRIFSYCVFFFMSSSAFSQTTWTYKLYSTVVRNETVVFKLEYGINSSGYNGYVKWRFTNYSNTILYDVSINSKKYTLSSGKIQGRSAEQFASVVESGKSVTTMSDAVNSDENTGFYSSKNDNPVVNILVNEPEITFKTAKIGDRISWRLNGAENSETLKANNNNISKETPKPKTTFQVQNQNNTNIDYKQTLKKADESFYSGDYSQALKLYNDALKSSGGTDNYIKNQIASLNKSGIKISNTLTQSEKKALETNTANLYTNRFSESPLKTNSTEKRNSRYNSKEAENIISQYKELLDEYLIVFKKSLSGDEIDLNILLEKTTQMEKFFNKYLANDQLFSEEFLEMIGEITENFTESMLSIAENISFENENEKRKYIQAKSPFIPAIKTPGAALVDPNPKQNSGGYTSPSSNTLPASVTVRPKGDFAPKKPKEKKK